MEYQWNNGVGSRSYTCGWCGNLVASHVGWRGVGNNNNMAVRICAHCTKPTIFSNDHLDAYVSTIPAKRTGREVEGLPDGVRQVYDEARDCLADNAPTAAAMLCRKLLMYIAVSKGAEENQQFIKYVDFLKEKHYIHPDGEEWADRVRNIGNEANHELTPIVRKDAEEILAFLGLLLTFIYELPHQAKQREGGENK